MYYSIGDFMKEVKFRYFLIAIIIGVSIGKYIFNQYNSKDLLKVNNEKKTIYLLQYGVYSSEEGMRESTNNLTNYFYYIDNNKYHVIIGITSNKDLKDKILNACKIDNVYLKKIEINNNEFLQILDQYDSLINQTSDLEVILNAEKQVLSKYEEVITVE